MACTMHGRKRRKQAASATQGMHPAPFVVTLLQAFPNVVGFLLCLLHGKTWHILHHLSAGRLKQVDADMNAAARVTRASQLGRHLGWH
jgi:hypothetical protein